MVSIASSIALITINRRYALNLLAIGGLPAMTQYVDFDHNAKDVSLKRTIPRKIFPLLFIDSEHFVSF